MKCAHCGLACTEKGEDMSKEIFDRIIKVYRDDMICIGGGEPTIHPFFNDILMKSIANFSDVFITTNGSMTEISLGLLKMAEKGVIGCALSLDRWHRKIDQRVVKAFKLAVDKQREKFGHFGHSSESQVEIRTANNMIKSGRRKTGSDDCICEEMFIMPNGNVKQCGCLDSPILGNVFDKKVPQLINGENYCCKSFDEEKMKKIKRKLQKA
jgi:MoaA/NifB/PqqE/SkfB family radical SAM enzyme